MTSALAPVESGSGPASRGSHGHRKATLTCPRCGHASPADGDWIVALDREDLVSLRCPVCRTRIATRWRTGEAVPPTWRSSDERR